MDVKVPLQTFDIFLYSDVIEAGLSVRERSGFVPGDEANILAQVNNSDIYSIKQCQLQLVSKRESSVPK